jgi:Beta-lactamase enzyme family
VRWRPTTLLVASLVVSLLAAGGGSPSDAAAAAGGGGTEARKPPRWHPDVAAARHYAARRAGEVAFAVIDPRGRLRGQRPGAAAPLASVFKAILLVAYLRMKDGERLRGGDRALLAPMIRRSDDVAATRVRDALGRRRIERLARAARIRSFRYHPVWGLSRATPRDLARFMFRLDSLVPGEHRSYARGLLSHVVRSQRWGVARAAPRGWRLFFKGGWGSGSGLVDHQVAFLERGRRRVALAIFTRFNPSHRYGKRTLRGVAGRLLRGLAARRPARRLRIRAVAADTYRVVPASLHRD